MITWRERITAARARGEFTRDDYFAWVDPKTCLVGEAVCAVLGEYLPSAWVAVNRSLAAGSVGLNTGLGRAITGNDFDFVERRLDEIEDKALRVKRARAAS